MTPLQFDTPRLSVRPFSLADAPAVERLSADGEIARMTLAIPHSYPTAMVQSWIATHAQQFEQGTHFDWAIELRTNQELIGSINLSVNREHARAKLGYWIGGCSWGKGYCTEAAIAVVQFGFQELGLQRIFAYHFTMNPASGRVLQKCGMTHEGTRRRHTLKDGMFLDNEAYGILRIEWAEHRSGPK